MGKKGGGSSAAPDPVATAQAQAQANKDAAIASAQINMIDQVGPYGTVKYSQLPGTGPQLNQAAYDQAMNSYNQALAQYNSPTTGAQGGNTGIRGAPPVMPNIKDFYTQGSDVPRYQQTTELDPSQQRQLALSNQLSENALNTGLGLWQNVTNATANPFKIQGGPVLPENYSADRDRIQGELYDRAMSRLEPQFQRDTNALENKLINQGLTRGSEAFDQALKENQYGINDARNSAMQSAIQQAGNEQSRMFGLNLAGRQQGIQEQSLERSQPINEIATLLGLGGSVQTPQFSAPPSVQIQPGDIQGNVWNAYNAQQQQNAQKQAGMNSLFGLAGNLGAAAIGLSDRSYKRNIKEIGTWHNGLKVYEFTYKNDPHDQVHIGFMADEVRKVHPKAVHTFFGADHVDYAEAVK